MLASKKVKKKVNQRQIPLLSNTMLLMSIPLHWHVKNGITVGTRIARAMFANMMNVQCCSGMIHRITVLTGEFLPLVMEVLVSQHFCYCSKSFTTCSTLHTCGVQVNMLSHLCFSHGTVLTVLAWDWPHSVMVGMMTAQFSQVVEGMHAVMTGVRPLLWVLTSKMPIQGYVRRQVIIAYRTFSRDSPTRSWHHNLYPSILSVQESIGISLFIRGIGKIQILRHWH